MPAVIDNPAIAMYVAAAVALVVLTGFFWYLWSIDRNVAEIRRRLNERVSAASPAVTPLRPRRRIEQEQTDGNSIH